MQAQERWWPGHHGLPGLSIPSPSLLGLAVSSEPSGEGKKPPWRHIPGLTPVRRLGQILQMLLQSGRKPVNT